MGHRHRRSGWLAVWTLSLSDNILLSASCRSAGSELKLWGREARESPLGEAAVSILALVFIFPSFQSAFEDDRVPTIPHFISFSSPAYSRNESQDFVLLLCNQIQYLVSFFFISSFVPTSSWHSHFIDCHLLSAYKNPLTGLKSRSPLIKQMFIKTIFCKRYNVFTIYVPLLLFIKTNTLVYFKVIKEWFMQVFIKNEGDNLHRVALKKYFSKVCMVEE